MVMPELPTYLTTLLSISVATAAPLLNSVHVTAVHMAEARSNDIQCWYICRHAGCQRLCTNSYDATVSVFGDTIAIREEDVTGVTTIQMGQQGGQDGCIRWECSVQGCRSVGCPVSDDVVNVRMLVIRDSMLPRHPYLFFYCARCPLLTFSPDCLNNVAIFDFARFARLPLCLHRRT